MCSAVKADYMVSSLKVSKQNKNTAKWKEEVILSELLLVK